MAALALGNPMMDGLQADPLPPELQAWRRLLLLGGSRMPEALANLERLLREDQEAQAKLEAKAAEKAARESAKKAAEKKCLR